MKKIAAAVAVSVFLAANGNAYKEPVHARITALAVERVVTDVEKRLGVSKDFPVRGERLRTWVELGSIHEDSRIPRPRSLNHFLNPIDEAPLTVGRAPLCITAGERADLWALGLAGPNDYSIPRARSHYLEALVGPNPGSRNLNLKELFYSLGHIVHLVQDMAQPEHTRNDQHLPWLRGFLVNAVDASFYEEWGLANLAPPAPNPPLVSFDGYANVSLPDYASYFHTTHRSPIGLPAGRGLADFANRNFVTQDTNYGDYGHLVDQPCYDYPAPLERETSFRLQTVRRSVLLPDGTCCIVREVDESILTSFPVDHYSGAQEVDPFHTFVSAVDIESRKYDANARFYSLGDESLQTRAAMLIPRAVGYSAGLIEHFFRGEIDADWKKTGTAPNFSYELTITNRSGETIGADAKISAIYRTDPSYFGRTNSDDTGSILRSADLAQLVPGFRGLAAGQSVTFTVPQIFALKWGDEITKFERRIAIRGTLGTEQDAVIGLVQSGSGPDKGLVFEITWDGTYFVATHIKVQTTGLNTQACYSPPPYGTCKNPPGVLNSRVIVEEAGRLAIGVDPVPPGASYQWFVNHAERTAKVVRAKRFLDGVELMDSVYVIPACTQTGWCHSIIELPPYP